jgi:transposase
MGVRHMSGKNASIEKYLKDKGVAFTFLEWVSPGSFDTKRSRENQARLGTPILEETKDRYVEALRNGDDFPPVIAYRLPSGQLEILDGNHRQAAHEELGQPMDVYLIDADTPPAVRALITFEANAKHGQPSTTQERLHHALYMVNNGKSVAKAAAMFGVPVHSLQKLTTLGNATRRAEDCGIPAKKWESIPTASQLKLNTVITDEGYIEAVKLTVDADLNAKQVSDMVRELNESKSAARQKAVAQALRESAAPAIQQTATSSSRPAGQHKTATSTPRGRVNLAMGQIRSAWTLVKPDTMTPTMKDELEEVLKAAQDEIAKMIQRLHDGIDDASSEGEGGEGQELRSA